MRPWLKVHGVRNHFIEGFGLGLFAETMFQIDASNEKQLAHADDPEEEINSVLKILQERLRRFQIQRVDMSGLTARISPVNTCSLEALNVRFIGPNLNLAPEADTKDGLLDIITVPDGKRAELGRIPGWANKRLRVVAQVAPSSRLSPAD